MWISSRPGRAFVSWIAARNVHPPPETADAHSPSPIAVSTPSLAFVTRNPTCTVYVRLSSSTPFTKALTVNVYEPFVVGVPDHNPVVENDVPGGSEPVTVNESPIERARKSLLTNDPLARNAGTG